MDLQFYPTPRALARRMIEMFKTPPKRILEPSAGDGALVRELVAYTREKEGNLMNELGHRWSHASKVHCDFIEPDITKHAGLVGMDGVQGDVVGMDFLAFEGNMALYDGILMNPPFRDGVHHLLKAWNGLFDGEIVCLLNAETIRNPYSKERAFLVRLIEEHGSVEFVQDAFAGDDAARKTDVEVAIVHLEKRCDSARDVLAGIFDNLDDDRMGATGTHGLDAGSLGQELAIPADAIDRTLRVFTVAVKCMREAAVASIRAQYTAQLLGEVLQHRDLETREIKLTDPKETLREALSQGYDALKDRAWAEVLRCTEFTSRLSSQAQKRLESDFERIKRLDFTRTNVLGFLIGLIESQGEMHVEMALEIFDSITRYHSENTVHYLSWKSNDRHRVAGRRLKTTRFVLPYFNRTWGRGLDFDKVKRLADIDKVFAVLDGKSPASTMGIANLFDLPVSDPRFQELEASKRVSSDYFDVRWYPKRGTIHFFARRKDLVDRLNRLVGQHRQWLPPQDEMVGRDFWLVYDRAEEFEQAIDEILGRTGRESPKHALGSRDPDEDARASDKVARAVLEVASREGLDPVGALTQTAQPQRPLLELQAA
jgi:hypothetical protein